MTIPLLKGRGGNRHPIPVKEFIIERLSQTGEDYISGLHQAYKDALDKLAEERHRDFYYHHPTYFSFSKKVWELIAEGQVEFSGREIPSDLPRFKDWKQKPMRKFVRLAQR